MKNPVYIIGAGGLGREIRAMLEAMPEWRVEGFYDDNKPAGAIVDGVPCLGPISTLTADTSAKSVIIAVGDPAIKAKILERLRLSKTISYPSLVHPSAVTLDPGRTSLGEGCIVAAGCILTTGISIGSHALLNLNVTVGHDSKIGECSSVMPGVNIAGNVQLGKGVYVGSGVNIVNRVSVGDFAKIGAGAVVIHDVRSEVTVVGVPARETALS